MIDTLHNSLTAQEQIADTLRDILASAYVIGLLLTVVVFLLIVSISTQRQTLSALKDMRVYASDVYNTPGNLDWKMTLKRIEMKRKDRQRRKSRKHRKAKYRKNTK